jgi:hypothetical protein
VLQSHFVLIGGPQKEMNQTKPILKIRRLKPGTKPLIILRTQRPQLDNSQAWSLAAIVDELTISLLDTKAVFCMINSNRKASIISDPQQAQENERCNSGNGVLRRLYEEQARYKMYRIPVFEPPPAFVIYLKHLDDRLKQELLNLDRQSKYYVIKEAIGRIFEQIDKRFLLLSVKSVLKWRLES